MKTLLTTRRHLALLAASTFFLFSAPFVGCNSHPSDEEIRQQTADATRDARKGAKEVAADTKVAAAKAVDGVNAVAQGVRDGVNSGKSGDRGDLVDINSASTARIAMLPGISISKAHDIVQGRPYKTAHGLVHRGLLTEEQYGQIADKITAK